MDVNQLDILCHLPIVVFLEDPVAATWIWIETARVWDSMILHQDWVLLPHDVAQLVGGLGTTTSVGSCTFTKLGHQSTSCMHNIE